MDDSGGGGAVPATAPETGEPPPCGGPASAKKEGGCGGAAPATKEGGCGGAAPAKKAGGCGSAPPADGAAEEKETLKDNYTKMYKAPDGEKRAADLGYTEKYFKLLPESMRKTFFGSANPWNLGDPAADSTVVDFGSGLGIDCFIAAKLGAGRVVGIDLTPKAVADSTKHMGELGMSDKISFREGDLEAKDLAKSLDLEGKVDLVTSNGVINLTDVKQKVFNNAFQFLKSGGWMRFSDMAVETPLPPVSGWGEAAALARAHWISGCVAVEATLGFLKTAGFVDVEFKGWSNYYTSEWTRGALFVGRKP